MMINVSCPPPRVHESKFILILKITNYTEYPSRQLFQDRKLECESCNHYFTAFKNVSRTIYHIAPIEHYKPLQHSPYKILSVVTGDIHVI